MDEYTQSEVSYKNGYAKGYADAMATLNYDGHCITVQEFIPISDPPKERGSYLCYFKYEPESPDVVCENTYYGSGHWMSEQDRVTHWTYLPKLPAGK